MNHIIRLARPWQLIEQGGNALVAQRRFNRPSGLSTRQAVHLVLRCHAGCRLVSAELNNQAAQPEIREPTASCRWSIERLMAQSNVLQLNLRVDQLTESQPSLSSDQLDLSVWVEVLLEIQGDAAED